MIDFINIYNNDTAQALITVKTDFDSTEHILYKGYVNAGQTLRYTDGDGWSLSPEYRPVQTITYHSHAGANFVMTNATEAERFAGNSTRHMMKVDLLGYSQVRLVTLVIARSNSANTPIIRLKYHTAFSSDIADFIQLGASAQVELSVATASYSDTGWINLTANAKVDGIYIVLAESGGDGAADPALGNTLVMFR